MAKKSTSVERTLSVASLHLDPSNLRIDADAEQMAPDELIAYLFEHEKAFEIAESIARFGWLPTDKILVMKRGGKFVVVEGNRRIAALKALKKPEVAGDKFQQKVAGLDRSRLGDLFQKVPVVETTSKAVADRVISARHLQNLSMAWNAKGRSRFVFERLEEGIEPEKLFSVYGIPLQEIDRAKKTRAITKMVKNVELSDEAAQILSSPRSGRLSTIQRFLDFQKVQQLLHIKPDAEHGYSFDTSAKQARGAMKRLFEDVASKRLTSRNGNRAEDVVEYIKKNWSKNEIPEKVRGSATPDSLGGTSSKSEQSPKAPPQPKKRAAAVSKKVIPSSFKVLYTESDKIKLMCNELKGLDRTRFPHAGTMLLRSFIEHAMIDYLDRTGELAGLKKKHPKDFINGLPKMVRLRIYFEEVVCKERLEAGPRNGALRCLKKDLLGVYNIDAAHGVVHLSTEIATADTLLKFWNWIQPLMKLMLSEPIPGDDQ